MVDTDTDFIAVFSNGKEAGRNPRSPPWLCNVVYVYLETLSTSLLSSGSTSPINVDQWWFLPHRGWFPSIPPVWYFWGFNVNPKVEKLRCKSPPRSPLQLSLIMSYASLQTSSPSASTITSNLLTSHNLLWPGVLHSLESNNPTPSAYSTYDGALYSLNSQR